MGVSNAWADNCGFWGDGAASITITVNGTDKTPSDLNLNGVSDFELGTVTTSLTIKSAWAKVWGKDQFNGIKLYYRVKGEDASSSAAYSSVSLFWDNNFNSNDQFWQNTDINKTISIKLAPGDYEIEYYFMADAKSESDKYLSNNGGNYHANFTIPSKKLTITNNGNGTTIGTKTGVTIETAYSIDATANAGYSFSKWTASSGASSITIANANAATTTVTFKDYANDATVTASFSAKTYTVTLDNQDATTAGASSVTATYNAAMPSIANNLPKKTGYTFNGYFDAKSGGNQYYKADGTSARTWNKTSNTTLYAQWTPAKYKITYKDQGDKAFSGEHTNPTQHTYGVETTLQTASKPGYNFLGWFTSSNCSGTAVTSLGATDYTDNITLYAKWEMLETPDLEYTCQRIYNDQPLNWIKGDGTQENPYQIFNDESARITITELPSIEGLTCTYKIGKIEQTNHIFNVTTISTEVTPVEISIFYKDNRDNNTSTPKTQTVYFQKVLSPSLTMVTTPGKDISLDRITDGEKIEWVYSATFNGYNTNVCIKVNEEVLEASTTATRLADDYIPNDIGIYSFTATTEEIHGRIFEARAEVAVYKLVTIKIDDPKNVLSKVYMWRDADDAQDADIKTEWPGEGFAQNFGTWRVFVVKYPYYTKFIVNDGSNTSQTENYDIPTEDKCYRLSNDKNSGGKYTLTDSECPGDLLVNDIDDITITKGDQKVIVPSVSVSLGNKLSDLITRVSSNNTTVATAIMSGTNIIVYGNSVGAATISVQYQLHGESVSKTFTVVVEKENITIQVKVPTGEYGEKLKIGWGNDNVFIYHWHDNNDNGSIKLKYIKEEDYYMHFQGEIPIDNNGKTNFLVYYENWNDLWRKTSDVKNVTSDGCYTLKNNGEGASPIITRSGDYCWKEDDKYQVKIIMQNGKEYSSNTVTNTDEILSFFAPGKDEMGYKAGTVMLYKNDRLHAAINPNYFSESNVYVAKLKNDLTDIIDVNIYSGNYYVRTDAAGDWGDYKQSDNKMTYFVPREEELYNHYWVTSVAAEENKHGNKSGKNVAVCIGNEYNNQLTDVLHEDHTSTTEDNGNIYFPTGEVNKVNVRFGYDPRTNYLCRAILKGSTTSDDFLNIYCEIAYLDEELGQPMNAGNRANSKLSDASNWVYEKEFYIPITNENPSASIYLVATAPNAQLYHLLGYNIDEITGEEDSMQPKNRNIIGSGTANGTYKMRVIYDFKTNRIITAWEPQDDITFDIETTINANVLLIRHENDDAPQIHLTGTGKVKSLETMYFAMELERGDEDVNQRHEEQYWFTLPFDCMVGSISGVPGYMETWGIQRYRGDLRAQNGWFEETPTFWEWLKPNDIMQAGEGYLLAFDKKAASWAEIDGKSILRLYFPSLKSGMDLQQQSQQQLERQYDDHTCTIPLHDRYKYDSNWKVIGTTSYNNAGIAKFEKDNDPGYTELEGGEAPKFRYKYEYEFDPETNQRLSYTYTPEEGDGDAIYKSFYGYMVQFAGTITWKPIMSETVPEAIAAQRHNVEGERTSITIRLEISNADNKKQDQTFIALDQNATTGFDQNKDLNKVINNGKANIYTISDNIQFAGNTLPFEETVVPVGVNIAAAGEYTFRMPDGTEGMVVELIDYEANTTTNLLLDDYTVNLPTGSNETRFALSIKPEKTATNVGNIGGTMNDGQGVRKFIIDGKLYLQKDGMLYDAQGRCVK